MQVRQTTLQAPATNTTQNYTVTGFGTPTAALITFSKSNDSAWASHAQVGIGFWDGTDNKCVQGGWETGVSPGTSSSRHLSNGAACVSVSKDSGSVGSRTASITSTVTDGVQITWAGADTSIRPFVTVMLINGINGAKCGHRTVTQTVDVATTTSGLGITPKLVFFAGRRSSTETGSGSQPGVFWGFACDNGTTYDQGYVGWRNSDIDPTDCNGRVSASYCYVTDVGNTGAASGQLELTNMASGSFETTVRLNTGIFTAHMYFALDFDESVVGWGAATPTSAGDFDPFTASFTPQWTFMFPTGHSSMDTSYSGTQDGQQSMGFYSAVDQTGEEDGHYGIMENGSTGVNSQFAQSRYDNRFEINTVTTGAANNLLNGNSPTFDSTGIVFADANFAHNATSRQVIGFFVEQQVGGTVGPLAYYHQQHNMG